MTTKIVAIVLATGSFLAVNFLNTNLLFSQSTLQIGETVFAQPSRSWKVVKKGINWVFAHTETLEQLATLGAGLAAKANASQSEPTTPTQAVPTTQKTYVSSLFLDQESNIYAWDPSNGWYSYDRTTRQWTQPRQLPELLYLQYNIFQSSDDGKYYTETPSGIYAYNSRSQGWVQFVSAQ